VNARNRMINALWSMATRRDATAFDRGAPIAREVQERRLLSLVARNRETAFGRDHNFSGVRSLDDFRARVPMRTYEDFTPWVDRIAGGEGGVLTTERVLLFEPTGGTHGGTKLIPYTRSLVATGPFLRSIATRPALEAGRQSVSMTTRDTSATPVPSSREPSLRRRRCVSSVTSRTFSTLQHLACCVPRTSRSSQCGIQRCSLC
jgi:hypothetical protein